MIVPTSTSQPSAGLGSPSQSAVPSTENLLMAAAVQHQMGRLVSGPDQLPTPETKAQHRGAGKGKHK